MKGYKVKLNYFFFCSIVIMIIPQILAQGVTEFGVRIPQKLCSDGHLPISHIKLVVSIDEDVPVSFAITDPKDQTITFPALQPVADPLDPISEREERDFSSPPGLTSSDLAIIIPPDGDLPATDPGLRMYEIHLYLQSDYDASESCCTSTWGPGVTEENWRIAIPVTSGSPFIDGVTVSSFDLNVPGNECGSTERPVPSTEPLAEIVDFPNHNLPRPGLDVIMVLDKSGSMTGSPAGGSGFTSKIQALQSAITSFINVWDNLRMTEGTGAPTDNIGIVLFDGTASWWTPGSMTAGFNDFETVKNTIIDNVGTISAGGVTSIGGGLELADGEFASHSADRRGVILLMSNGKQNTPPLIQFDDPTDPTQITNPPLVNKDDYHIYSVTIGTGTAVNAAINMKVADLTNGFYINSEDNAELLNPFFLDLLQNFVKFSTVGVLRQVEGVVMPGNDQGGIDRIITVPVTTSARNLHASLMWRPRHSQVLLKATSPTGVSRTLGAGLNSGFLHFSAVFPDTAYSQYWGDWQFEIIVSDQPTPLYFVVMSDDIGLKSSMKVVNGNFKTGDPIVLQASVSEGGRPILGLGDDSTDVIHVTLLEPGQSIGDMLAGSDASATPPSDTDTYSAADAKLHNELTENPQSLITNTNTLRLFDDGDPEHGDKVPGDGIYTNIKTAGFPGHYNFLFGIQGISESKGKFSQMHLETVYVRDAPDTDETDVSSTVQSGADGNTLVTIFTPRNRFGQQMGPGWGQAQGQGSYFWFVPPGGGKPYPAIDNLDGTYQGTYFYGSGDAPQVALHFVDAIAYLPEGTTVDNLPVPLDGGSVLVPDVNDSSHPWWWAIVLLVIALLLGLPWWVILILAILIAIYLYYRYRGRTNPC